MGYGSVDALQCALTSGLFAYAKDPKKAAGRALGTLVEMIAFYLLKSWGFEKHIAIEREVPEYGNPDIRHNVEFTLHPSVECAAVRLPKGKLPITPKKIAKQAGCVLAQPSARQLLTRHEVLRNACTIHEDAQGILVAYLGEDDGANYSVALRSLLPHPFAVVECKRVGVEEGMKKGPQTIEKAKQGAYVARTVSSLQRVRRADGSVDGVLESGDGKLVCKPYLQFLQEVIASDDPAMLRSFTLTVGLVSNHGNWFTSGNHNKELKVLAQSYDWLIFLTDEGLSEFVHSLLVTPQSEYAAVEEAFHRSYTGAKGLNVFTKVQIALAADQALQKYFRDNEATVARWFNVISPPSRSMKDLREVMHSLANKDWARILR